MGAHLRPITRSCDISVCTKPATVQLYNTWNARCGTYCEKHGKAALADLQRREAADVPAGRRVRGW